jgi:hypothetical protein
MENQENNAKKYMTAQEAAAILSQTIKDMADRKITMRHALTVSRIAVALAKVIEVADLNERVEFLERTLKKKK